MTATQKQTARTVGTTVIGALLIAAVLGLLSLKNDVSVMAANQADGIRRVTDLEAAREEDRRQRAAAREENLREHAAIAGDVREIKTIVQRLAPPAKP